MLLEKSDFLYRKDIHIFLKCGVFMDIETLRIQTKGMNLIADRSMLTTGCAM